ncbi:uncharacterized protein [Epargyreus clarus]|uniref:uncharacterized protein n=1 Tax=Epargyreus clarus TaxID=520877 RepID=UPI003C2EDBAE
MSPMMLLFFCFVGINSAVIVDKADGAQKGYDSDNNNGWQVFKMYHPPGAQSVVKYETFAYPKYEFEYAVSDRKTGDHKHHYESRDGHRVRGEYGLVEADGSLRKVQYNADDFNGFNAVVSKTVNKHSDAAYSVSGHTRQFLPIGQGVKINHFFPSKDYQYQETKLNKEAASKPVQEATVESSLKPDESSIVAETREAVLPESVPQVNTEYQPIKTTDASIIKMDTVEGPSYKVLPADHEKVNLEENVSVVPITEKSVKDSYTTQEEQAHKEDPHDSEVASSYYHSKVYYVGF